jgi:hypothetical protein
MCDDEGAFLREKGTPQYKSRILLKMSQKMTFILRGPFFRK